mmetsp:Transcript_11521/g.25522  ORF Transcript_11521/g.25522 Transcript_11521/m.25522 type:complete len:281 (+) Transcript_11521:1177-2019(+)
MIQKVNQESHVFGETMLNMSLFMSKRRVPISLQMKVKNFLQEKRSQMKSTDEAVGKTIADLSPWLRFELMTALHGSTLCLHPFFNILPQQVLGRVCAGARLMVFAQGDVVVQSGHVAQCMFFVVSGRLQVLGSEHVMKALDYLGDSCLFLDNTLRKATVVAIQHAELLHVGRVLIDSLIQEIPSFRRLYRMYQVEFQNAFKASHHSKTWNSSAAAAVEGLAHRMSVSPKKPIMGRSQLQGFQQQSEHGQSHNSPDHGNVPADSEAVGHGMDDSCLPGAVA